MGPTSGRTCEVCGLKERHCKDPLFFAGFPLDEDRCRQWLKMVGNPELVQLRVEKLHQIRHVCQKHFTKKDFTKKGNRLRRHAVPSLNLHAAPLSDDQLSEFPLHIFKKSSASVLDALPSTSHQTMLQQASCGSVPDALPSTNQQIQSTQQQASFVFVDGSTSGLPSTSQQIHPTLQHSCVSVPDALPSTSQQIQSTLQQTQSTLQQTLCETTPIKVNKGDCIGNFKGRNIKRKLESMPDLTPRKKKLMEQLSKTKCTLASLKKSAKLIDKIESPVLKEMVSAAIINQNRALKGRRWTTKSKISALSIFKRSPKTYRYLQHLIPLPSTKTLYNVLKKVPVQPGICKMVLEHLKKVSIKKDSNDTLCGLVFDEIALKQRLIYDAAVDRVIGYEDVDDMHTKEVGRTMQLADHALVFMLQGIKAKFKQPLAFYFVKGTISSQKLASLIKKIVIAVEETGFKVLVTICDQGPTNMGAMKILKESSVMTQEPNQNFFNIDKKKVYIIYDVPHLFKSIRNNFQNYGEIVINGKTAKWSHLIKVEEKNRQLLYLSKITPLHVQPKYRAKMKVKYAVQILSNTVAAVLKLIAQAEKNMTDELMETAEIIQDLDRLFDISNGPSCPDNVKKGQRENVSKKSHHLNAWVDYRKKLDTVKFKKPNGVIAKNVKCVQGYITTLKSLGDLWKDLEQFGFKYMNLRQLNQDALENLFGVIRQHSPTNRNPTCYSFIAALKTSLISGMTAPHNRGSNCEKDNKKLLTNFHNVIFEDPLNFEELPLDDNKENKEELSKDHQEDNQEEIPVLSIPDHFEYIEIESDLAEMEHQPLVYVGGYIASTILKNLQCKDCEESMIIVDPQPDEKIYMYIQLREWWEDKKSLTYPSIDLCRLVEAAVEIFKNEVIPNIYYKNICNFAITMFITKCNFTFLKCEKHRNKLVKELCTRLALLLIRRQCQRVNQTIALQEETLADANKKAQQSGTAK